MIRSLYVSSLFAGVLEDILTSLYKEGVWKVDKISNLVLDLACPSHSSLPTEARLHACERKMKKSIFVICEKVTISRDLTRCETDRARVGHLS